MATEEDKSGVTIALTSAAQATLRAAKTILDENPSQDGIAFAKELLDICNRIEHAKHAARALRPHIKVDP